MREQREPINRYNIGKLATEEYVKSLSPNNLKTSFAKTGIYPFNKKWCACHQHFTLQNSQLFK
jgi:hypothetical protein